MNSRTPFAKSLARGFLPLKARQWIGSRLRPSKYSPPVGGVAFGSLRRVRPIGTYFGFSRGQPVDRYYIEKFLGKKSAVIRGRVLEIAEDTYTRRFGGGRVTGSDVLHVHQGYPGVTIVADLTQGDHIPSDAFDCILCTQTLQFIYDPRSAIRTLYRILKPGGFLLATMSGISQISRDDMEAWGDCWRYTSFSARKQFEEIFPEGSIHVQAYGNALSATAFLQCLAQSELTTAELDFNDPDYQLIVAVDARKPQ